MKVAIRTMPELLQAVDRIKHASSFDALAAEIRKVMGDFGLEKFTISGLPDSSSVESHVLVSGWPEWGRRYHSAGHYRFDPIANRLKVTADPVVWNAIPHDRRGCLVMGEAAEFGLKDGISIPILDVRGVQSAVSFASSNRISLSQEELLQLQLVAIFIRHRAVILATARPAAPVGRLTQRELECLRWAAAGKSAWDTSIILGLSCRTIEHYLDSALRKLNAVNKVQAVAMAVGHGLLT